MLASVIVLNWNGWRDTIACLQSLIPITHQHRAHVVIVDNGSTDDSVSRILGWLRSMKLRWSEINGEQPYDAASTESSSFALIKLARNRGYAAGNNAGIKFSLVAVRPKFLWILNNDTVIRDGSLDALVMAADASPDVAVWGSTVLEFGDTNNIQAAGGANYNPFLTMNKNLLAGRSAAAANVPPSSPKKLTYVSGSAMFLRTDVVRKIGFLDERYFLYYEEIDYAYRLRAHGYRIGWCPGSLVLHKGGASAGSRSKWNANKSFVAEFHSNLSCLLFSAKFYPYCFPVIALTRFVLKFGQAVLTLHPKLMRPVTLAYVHYFSERCRTQ